MKLRLISRVLVLALVVVVGSIIVLHVRLAQSHPATASKLAGIDLAREPAPNFALVDQNGTPVSLEAQRGHPVVLTFLYTHCKDICPLIASSLNAVLVNLKEPERQRVRVIAVSVDPRGDTFTSVRRYAKEKNLLPQFRYLVGSKQELQPVWSAYGILIDPVNLESIDHTGRIIVIDRKGELRAGFPPTVAAAKVLADVKKLL